MSEIVLSLHSAGPPAGHWLSPGELLSELGDATGLTAAVFEAEPGHYALPIARALTPSGCVVPVTAHGAILSATLPAESLSLLILADLFHANPAILPALKPSLQPGGRLILFDWNHTGPCPPGPPLVARISLHDAICAAERASFTLLHARSFGAGYLLSFEPTDESVQS
jgi:hypothetical protein